MRIDRIILNNFGSYQGETVFDTNSESGKNIVLIGGKNGAGKTTLFTAMRVCLYGYMSMGYKNQNAYYTRAITKLINNNAKMSKPAYAHVAMGISLSNGQELDHYEIFRGWTLQDSLTETLRITKNGRALTTEEVADFEKYLLSLIPPELFNLYFFDGEKIADFFMNEGSNTRIKEAFLTLCGYDTFDIMRRNFKRISSSDGTGAEALDAYWEARQSVKQERLCSQELQNELSDCMDQLAQCDADLNALEKDYAQKGGISQEDWNQKLFAIREEEKKREAWNAMLRKWANDMVPFLMIRNQVEALKTQISKENDSQKYSSFCQVLELPEVKELVGEQSDKIRDIAYRHLGGTAEMILDLSLEESAAVLGQIGAILSFDPQKIPKYKRAIQKSLALTTKLHQELDRSNVLAVQEYMQQRALLFEKKSELLDQRVILEQNLARQNEKLHQAEQTLAKTQTKLEAEIKKASINDISAKAIIMLDKLQKILYRQQIERVEKAFKKEISALMRKSRLIDDIKIDEEFRIRLYRQEEVKTSRLMEAIQANSEDHLYATIGQRAVEELQKLAGGDSAEALLRYCEKTAAEEISLPVLVDQSSLSNGEKQIFIMALYHALVQLGRHEIPFIIDTPFARIDTEHRMNISKYFFSKLNGQVFILSTNEEINSTHVQILQDKIAATYMLENTDNKKTVIVQDSYFEV